MHKTMTMSLSRWHKAAERLSRDYTESVVRTRDVLTQTRVSAFVGEGQQKHLKEEAEMAGVRLARAFRLQEGIAAIRSALGDENVRLGISARLAQYDMLNRRQKVLTDIIDGQSADMIAVEELAHIPSDYVADGDSYDRRRPQLRVRLLDRDTSQRLQAELDQIRARAYALADAIAEMNKASLTLELTEEVAQAAGL